MSKTEKRKPSTGPHRAHELVEQATQLYRSYSQMSRKITRDSGDGAEPRDRGESHPHDASESWYVEPVEPRRKRPESYHAGMRDSYSSHKRDSRPGEKRTSQQSQKRESQTSRRRESYHGDSKGAEHTYEDMSTSSPEMTALPQEYRSNGSGMRKGSLPTSALMTNKQPGTSRNGEIREPAEAVEARRTGRRGSKPKNLIKASTGLSSRQEPSAIDQPDIRRLERNEGSQSSVNSNMSSRHIPRRPVGSKNGSISHSHLSNSQLLGQPSPANPDADNMGKMRNLFSKSKPKKPSHGKSSSSLGLPLSHDRSNSSPADAERSQQDIPLRQGVDRDKDRRERDRKEKDLREKERRDAHAREDSGSNFLKGFKEQTARAARGIEKAGRGIFQKRDQMKDEQPAIDYSKYELKIINRPLVEQTRMTRIVKRIEDSKDKTEFWMPALPWRCIDYLNYNGIESEGLYRIPGSTSEVRMWKARFDQELDINLFDEPELYDINAIGSLFKAWLRDLPDDVFPQMDQYYFSDKYHHEQNCPEELKAYLANLHPFQYYMLFAVTCHLSLMYAFEEQNKMSFQNLYVCFGPALRLNGDCFRWLVGDWRSCFGGCLGEPRAIEEEYRYLQYDVVPVESGKTAQEHTGESRSEEQLRDSDTDNDADDENREFKPRGGARLGAEVKIPQKSKVNPLPTLSTLPGIGPPPNTKEYEMMRLKEEYDRMSKEDIQNAKHFHKKQAIFEKYELPTDQEYEMRVRDAAESDLPYHLRPSRFSATWTTQRSVSRSPERVNDRPFTREGVHGESSHPSSREGGRPVHRLHPRSPERAGGSRSPEVRSRGTRTPHSSASRSPEARHVQSHADLRSSRARAAASPDHLYNRSANLSFANHGELERGRNGMMSNNDLNGRSGQYESEPVYSHEGFPREGDDPDPFFPWLNNTASAGSEPRRAPTMGNLPTPPPLRLGGNHARSISQLPELDFPQPISPTFATRRGS